MTDKNILIGTTRSFDLTGEGKSLEEVYNRIFSMVRSKVYDAVPGVIIQMEPKEVYLVSMEEEKVTEKFLFLFLPREKTNWTVKVKLVVDIKYIRTEGD
ncbi:MAG: DUF4312 family protein [Chloroflexota bacterium]|nr:DUF4312 family protein [Chloroflexota bacterium]